MFYAYLKTFQRLGLKSIPMKAETGPIGGDLSHEFIILADTGESKIFADKRIFDVPIDNYKNNEKSLKKMREDFSKFYAVTDDKFKKKILIKMLKKMINYKQKELRLVIYFILATNILNQ